MGLLWVSKAELNSLCVAVQVTLDDTKMFVTKQKLFNDDLEQCLIEEAAEEYEHFRSLAEKLFARNGMASTMACYPPLNPYKKEILPDGNE